MISKVRKKDNRQVEAGFFGERVMNETILADNVVVHTRREYSSECPVNGVNGGGGEGGEIEWRVSCV